MEQDPPLLPVLGKHINDIWDNYVNGTILTNILRLYDVVQVDYGVDG